MDLGSLLYLGVTFGLFAVFVTIAIRTYSKKNKDSGEAPKYNMLNED